MTLKNFVTAGELRKALLYIPADTIIDIAQDPELNRAGPIAMQESGELSAAEETLDVDGKPRKVMILWPLEMEQPEDRYV